MKIVHLPSYSINPYQKNLVKAQTQLGHEALEGGEGGNFLRTALFRWRADIIHFHWLHPYLLKKGRAGSLFRSIRFVLEALILRFSGARVAWTIHNLKNHANLHTGIERCFTAIFARICCCRIAHSKEAARLAEKRFRLREGSVTVIPHPSYVGLYPDEISRAAARRKLGLSEETKVLLFIGRINAYKGVHDLLAALDSLQCRVELVVAGVPEDPSMADQLEAAAARNSRLHLFLGRFEDEEMQVYFRSADVVVYPYRQILTSGAVILGMSFGAFVVAPDVPTIRETVSPEGGVFFEPGNVESLRKAISTAIEMDGPGRGRRNYERASEWNLPRIAELTIECALGKTPTAGEGQGPPV